jgi:DNA primase
MVPGRLNVDAAKQIPIKSVAQRLGLTIVGNKTLCFGDHDSSPSLSLWIPANRWKCFGCGKTGSTIDLVMAYLRCDFRSAVEWLVGEQRTFRSATPAPRIRIARAIVDCPKPASDVWGWLLAETSLSDAGRAYLLNRGLSDEVISKSRITDCNNIHSLLNRAQDIWPSVKLLASGLCGRKEGRVVPLLFGEVLIIPFYQRDELRYIQFRHMDSREPKYWGPSRVSKPLYNQDCIQGLPPGHPVLVCEGVMDVLSALTLGHQAVGVLGASSFVAEFAALLAPFKVRILRHRDTGGRVFAASVASALASFGRSAVVVDPPTGKDLSDALRSWSSRPRAR